MARKPSDTVQLNLRVKETLRRALAAEAKKNNRSINAEMAHRLQQSFSDDLNNVVAEGAALKVGQIVLTVLLKRLDQAPLSKTEISSMQEISHD